MKNIKESLLDNFNDIVSRAESSIYLEKIYDIWNTSSSNTNSKKIQDGLGRPLQVNDIVLIGLSSGEVMTGRIVDINKKVMKSIAVSMKGDGSDITILAGSKKGQISEDNYYYPCDVIKINENILKLIYHIK